MLITYLSDSLEIQIKFVNAHTRQVLQKGYLSYHFNGLIPCFKEKSNATFHI